MTKQGIRDLNYYGPKPAKARSPARSAATAETSDSKVVVPTKVDAALAVDA